MGIAVLSGSFGLGDRSDVKNTRGPVENTLTRFDCERATRALRTRDTAAHIHRELVHGLRHSRAGAKADTPHENASRKIDYRLFGTTCCLKDSVQRPLINRDCWE